MMYKFAAALALATSVSADVFTVSVGKGGFVYTPNNIVAKVGDVVNFVFDGSPGNHTVSQASFTAPCAQLAGGFDSSYVGIPTGFSGTTPQWNLTITDASKPIWFYCKQTNPSPHCIQGMVGAINAPATGNTLDAFKAAAAALSGLPTQTLGSLTGVGAAASSLPSPIGSGGSSLPASASGITANGTSASGTGSGSAASTGASGTSPAPSTTKSGNSAVIANAGSLWYLLAGLLGVTLA